MIMMFCYAMKDLTTTSFCVPAVYKHSPLSYAIVRDVHWNNPVVQHGGNESVQICAEESFHHRRTRNCQKNKEVM